MSDIDLADIDENAEGTELSKEDFEARASDESEEGEEENRDRYGYMWCNDLYLSGGRWYYKRDTKYSQSDPKTRCGKDRRWMKYDPGDKGFQHGRCADKRWFYKLTWK